MRLRPSVASLAIVTALLVGTAPAQAGPIAPGTAGVIVLLGEQQFTVFADEEGRISETLDFRDDEGQILLQGAFNSFVNPDPFIQYGVAVANATGAPFGFGFVFFSPYVNGPYNTLQSSHTSSVTDSGAVPDDNVTVLPNPLGDPIFNHVPIVDLTPVTAAAFSNGCVVNPPGNGGGSDSCFAPSNAVVPFSTAASGIFYAYLGFILSNDDIYTASGRVELLNDVPEPSALALLGLGGVVVARRLRRRTA
jgi:hypothetical protein